MSTWGKLRRQAGGQQNAQLKELGSLDAKTAWAALQSPDGFGQVAAQASTEAARTVATSGEAQGCVTVVAISHMQRHGAAQVSMQASRTVATSGQEQGKREASAACLTSSCMLPPCNQGKKQAWLGLLSLI